jgi:hypothetical protein
MLKDFFETGLGVGIFYVVVILCLIVAGVAVDRVFFEPQRQAGYQSNITMQLTDWCGASPTDPFNMQTLSAIKGARDGNPSRFGQMPVGLKNNVNAAVNGDRMSACGHK